MAQDSVGAIWRRTAKSSGKEYLSIVFTRADGSKSEFIAFENDKGGNEKRPDYKIYKSEPRQNNGQQPQKPGHSEAQSQSVGNRPPNNGRPNTAGFRDDIPGQPIDNSDIPF